VRPEPEDERLEISYRYFLVSYLTIFVLMQVVAWGGYYLLDLDPFRLLYLFCGLLFTLAAIGVPRRLYLVVRNTGWFYSIQDPRIMRLLLLVLGVGLLLAAFLAPSADLHPSRLHR
jgi:hypothetical protein